MEKIISFIFSNYQLFILVFACLVDVILFILTLKRKKSDPVLDMVLRELPNLINRAELQFGAGSGGSKLGYVLMVALKYYKTLTGVTVSEDSAIAKKIKDTVELILSTPTKKGK